MKLHIKSYRELTRDELYAILRLRVSVFVVEQNCPYQEIDDLDQGALHLWLEDADGIEAYLRVLDRGAMSEYVSIGRVVTSNRNTGYGSLVLKKGIEVAEAYFRADRIYLEAQTYAKGFYEKEGFRQISEEFVMDGIAHVKMLREKNQ